MGRDDAKSVSPVSFFVSFLFPSCGACLTPTIVSLQTRRLLEHMLLWMGGEMARLQHIDLLCSRNGVLSLKKIQMI
jgi:hypothetical protein